MEKVQSEYEKVPITENGYNNGKQEEILQYGFGVRHIQALLIFSSLCISIVGRAHLGVTVVAMIDDSSIIPKKYSENLQHINGNNTHDINENTINMNSTHDINVNTINGNNTHDINDNKTTHNFGNKSEGEVAQIDTEDGDNIWNVYRTYKWPKTAQDMILGSFFVGYMIMMFPMGLVCQKFGGKLPLQIGLFSTAVVSILSPWLAVWGGWKAICLSRIVMGLTQAGTYPSIHALIAKWIPKSEMGRMGNYIYVGSMIGTVIAFQIGGFLASSLLGWPATFWVTGVLSMIMFSLLTVFGAATPMQHKTISQDEKNFILGRVCDGVELERMTPWKALLTSKHVWATFASHIGCSIAYLFFFTQMPSYLHFIQHVNVRNSGILSSLPYLSNFTFSIGMGYLCDYCTNKKIVTIKQARIISNTVGSVGPALCLAAVSFTSNTTLAVTCLVIGLGTHGGGHTGWMVNYIDLAPNYSGALMATGNTIMNIIGVGLPMIISFIVIDVTNPYQWRILLFLIAGFVLLCHLVFSVFMSADLQPWNDYGYEATEQEDKEMKEIKGTKQ